MSFKFFKRRKTIEEKVNEAIREVPKITNDTVANHREDVLSRARKYIYPLQESKKTIVKTSVSLFILVIIIFLGACGLDLYKFQGTSGFIYGVTEILPFPAAKTDGKWVSYESYLFELRRNMHYYVSQQQANFSTKNGKTQLSSLKKQSLNYAVQIALVNKLAQEHKVSVSNKEVNSQVNLLKAQNRLGSNNNVLREVLNEYYGWDINDFKRELKQELLAQAVATKLDTAATATANSVLSQLKSGADFGTLAAKYSDDTQTKNNGGQYASSITANDQQISPVIVNALFQLKPGQISGIVNTGYSLDIVKVLTRNSNSLTASHIQININNISTYLKPLEQKYPTHNYIKV